MFSWCRGNDRRNPNQCVFYPDKDYGSIIIVNDNISQEKVGDIENTITRTLAK